MNSGKFAKLAGVTPRTLRHYRSIGLLDDISQNENGYYDYDIYDLLKILRIKNLTSLGFSLEMVKDMLDQKSAESNDILDELDELDRKLEKRIKQLQKQRRTIAILKRAGVTADTPAAFARLANLLIKHDYPPELLERELDGLLLIDHLLEEKDLDEVLNYYERLIDYGHFKEYCDLSMEIYRLRESATEEEKNAVAEKGAVLFQKILDDCDFNRYELNKHLSGSDDIDLLFRMYDGDEFYSLQMDVADRIAKILQNKK